jgi:SAM-dependent methyltransferase
MSLRFASAKGLETPLLPKGPPYLCADLKEWVGFPFWITPHDTRLIDIHNGGNAPSQPLENLQGMIRYWDEHPEWMDMLNPQSPVFIDKQIESELYLDFWQDEFPTNKRVLDMGGGVGRMTQLLLKRGCSVELVDPDLRSLWRALSMAAGGPGSIDVHWTTGEHMPVLEECDAAIACEVLNYVENPKEIVRRIYKNLTPNGTLLLSVEARWGWALSSDVAEGSIDAFFGDGIVHIPNDRWIRTYTRKDLEELLSDFTDVKIQPSHYAFSGPFEMATGLLPTKEAIRIENRFREHPIANQLNRAWMAIAHK